MFKIRHLIITLGFGFALAACGQTSPIKPVPTLAPSTPSQTVYGKLEFEIGDTESGLVSKPGLQSAISENSIQIVRIVQTRVEETATERHLWRTFEVKNASTSPITNFTLYAYTQSANSQAGTALKAVRRLDDTPITDPAVIRGIRPSASLTLTNGVFTVDPTRADLQAFRPSEALQVEDGAKVLGSLQPNDSVLEYGFLMRSASGDRTFEPGELGTVTTGWRYPLPVNLADTPRKWTFTSTTAADPVSRTTRDPLETTGDAAARAVASGASELALLGSDTETAPAPLNTVRLIAPKTFEPPYFTAGTASASIDSSGGIIDLDGSKLVVPPNAVTALTPFTFERLVAPPAPLPDAQAMSAASDARAIGTYRVTVGGVISQSLFALLRVPGVSDADGQRTELYGWDGVTYEKVQIAAGTSTLLARVGLGASNGSVTFVAYRASVAALRSVCQARGGVWNGGYCEYAPVDTVSPQSLPSRAWKTLAFNAGNSLTAGGRTANLSLGRFPCKPYAFKLCSVADEERARAAITAVNPTLLAVQEVWHNYCDVNRPREGGLRSLADLVQYETGGTSPPLATLSPEAALIPVDPNTVSDYICSHPGLASTQMGRIAGHTRYTIRCTVSFDPDNQPGGLNRKNGYECTGLRIGVFEFTSINPNGDGPTPLQEQVSPSVFGGCSQDTGFQFERVRLIGARGPLDARFLLANAHLASPVDSPRGDCQAAQIRELTARVRSDGGKALALGDFNTDDEANTIILLPSLDVSAAELNFQVSRFNTLVSFPPFTDVTDPYRTGRGFTWSMVSNPNQSTTSLGSLDHVISNFSYVTSPCTRASAGSGFDHKYTLCDLKGFESGQVNFQVFEDLLDRPTPGARERRTATDFTIVSHSRYGLLLPYVRILSNPNNLNGDLVLALPDGEDVLIYLFNRRCNPTIGGIPVFTNTLPINRVVAVAASNNPPIGPPTPMVFETPKGTNNWCL